MHCISVNNIFFNVCIVYNVLYSVECLLSLEKMFYYSIEASLFEIEQLDNSSVALKAPNGKYITIKMTGALNASSDTCGDKEKFKVSKRRILNQ